MQKKCGIKKVQGPSLQVGKICGYVKQFVEISLKKCQFMVKKWNISYVKFRFLEHILFSLINMCHLAEHILCYVAPSTNAIDIGPNDLIVSAGGDQAIRLWDFETMENIKVP